MVGRALMLAVAAVVFAGCSSVAAPTPANRAPTTAPSRTASPTAEASPILPAGVTDAIPIPRWVWGIESAGDTLWAEGNDVLHQVDGETGAMLQTIPGFAPDVTDDTLWYQRESDLVAADAATGVERAVYHPPKLGSRVVHDGVLWVASEESGTLSRVDLASNEVADELELPDGEPKWVEYWEGAIWVVIDGSNVVLRVDAETGELIESIDAGSRPHSVELAFGSMWVTQHGARELLRLGPDGTVQATIAGPGINVAVTSAGDQLWAASPAGLMQVDPATNEVVREIELGTGDWYDLAATEGHVWLATAGGGYIYKIPLS